MLSEKNEVSQFFGELSLFCVREIQENRKIMSTSSKSQYYVVKKNEVLNFCGEITLLKTTKFLENGAQNTTIGNNKAMFFIFVAISPYCTRLKKRRTGKSCSFSQITYLNTEKK